MVLMIYWLVVTALSLFIALMLARALLRSDDGDSGDADLAVYKDQLKEVDRDLARGVLTDDDAKQARLEVSRRLLEADKLAQTRRAYRAPLAVNFFAVGAIGVILVLGSGALYVWQGAPWYPDLPMTQRLALAEETRATRMSQEEAEARLPPAPTPEAEAQYLELVAQLREAVSRRPDDLQGHRLLARHEAQLGNFGAAHLAQSRVIELSDAHANDHAILAELLVLAARGYVSPEAEAAYEAALVKDPGNGTARYYKGLLETQTGRPDLAFATWRALFEDSRGDEPWVPVIRDQIETLAAIAGTEYQLPQIRVPNADAGQAAMIEGMVEGLASRLATEGGSPEEWARLIRALGVLGQYERASAIWAEAQTVFPETEGLSVIRQAAETAGIEE